MVMFRLIIFSDGARTERYAFPYDMDYGTALKKAGAWSSTQAGLISKEAAKKAKKKSKMDSIIIALGSTKYAKDGLTIQTHIVPVYQGEEA